MRRGVFSIPQFRRFLAGMLCGEFASQMQTVAIGWHVFTLDHRPFDLGLVGLALFIPTCTLWPFTGVFVDRHDRRAIAAVGAVVEALSSCGFALLALRGEHRLWPYLGVLVVVGTVRAFTSPAERSLLPSLVDAEGYLPAQASYASLREMAVIGGPALGGILVAFSTGSAFFTTAGLMLVSAVALAGLHARRAQHEDVPTLRSALDGVRFILARPVIAGAISLDLFAVLFGGMTSLLPVFADVILKVGPIGLGVLRSLPAAGASIVALVLSRRPPRRRIGLTLIFTVAGFGLATIAFALSKNVVLSGLMLLVIGGTDMVSVVIRNGLVQLGTPDAMRGRVNAVENVFIGASNELGAFESGTLAALIGTVPSVVVGGAGTLVVIALCAVLFPALRRADSYVALEVDAATLP